MSEWTETLRYFSWKIKSNTSDIAYNALRNELEKSGRKIESLKATRNYLEGLLGLHIQEYHRCVNNCLIFAGDDLLKRNCRFCEVSRFFEDDPAIADFDDSLSYSQLTPRAVYSYMPLTPRLKLLYANPEYAKKMRYPKTLRDTQWEDGIRDIWEGRAMKHWMNKGYFNDERAVALHFSTDGVQLFRNSTQEAWPFLVLNMNLPPKERCHPCFHLLYLLDTTPKTSYLWGCVLDHRSPKI